MNSDSHGYAWVCMGTHRCRCLKRPLTSIPGDRQVDPSLQQCWYFPLHLQLLEGLFVTFHALSYLCLSDAILKKKRFNVSFNINFRFFSNHWVILTVTVTVSATFSGALAFNVSITATVCLDDCPCHYQSLLRVSHFYSRLSDTISVTLAVIATLSVFVTVTLPAPSLSLSRTPRWSRAY